MRLKYGPIQREFRADDCYGGPFLRFFFDSPATFLPNPSGAGSASRLALRRDIKRMRSKMLTTCVAMAAGLIAVGATPALAGQDKCENARAGALRTIHAQFDDAIAANNAAINNMRAHKQDPDDIAVRVKGVFMPLPAFSAKLESDRTALMAGANEQADGCNARYELYQKAAEVLVDTYTGGVEHLLPGKMGHIDVSEIMDGYPLGGPNAVIPQIRTQIFEAVGMGPTNDLRKIIENPLGGPNSFFRKPFG